MRLRALLGGFAIVATIALSRRPPPDPHAAGEGGLTCNVASPSGFCAAVVGLTTALRNPMLRMDRADILPPPETPGALDPSVTQANIDQTICRPGYARAVRPAYAVTAPFKRRLMAEQRPGERLADYELDHLIPISIGGAPFDARDLWLQPRFGQANAGDKNVLDYVLWRLVCERRVPLRVAQRAISSDWTEAYARYATPENIARYHFRRREGDGD